MRLKIFNICNSFETFAFTCKIEKFAEIPIFLNGNFVLPTVYILGKIIQISLNEMKLFTICMKQNHLNKKIKNAYLNINRNHH